MKNYKERRLYFFTCARCHKPNCKSFHRKRVKAEVCRKCLRSKVSENQINLFPPGQSDFEQELIPGKNSLGSRIEPLDEAVDPSHQSILTSEDVDAFASLK